jgi:hypothetical protein
MAPAPSQTSGALQASKLGPPTLSYSHETTRPRSPKRMESHASQEFLCPQVQILNRFTCFGSAFVSPVIATGGGVGKLSTGGKITAQCAAADRQPEHRPDQCRLAALPWRAESTAGKCSSYTAVGCSPSQRNLRSSTLLQDCTTSSIDRRRGPP